MQIRLSSVLIIVSWNIKISLNLGQGLKIGKAQVLLKKPAGNLYMSLNLRVLSQAFYVCEKCICLGVNISHNAIAMNATNMNSKFLV